MIRKHLRWAAAGLLLLGLLTPGTASAGPYIGDWSWCWKPAKDCPRGDYCFLHYWTPALYRVIYCVHPAYLDQYPPGKGILPSYQLDVSPCRTATPMPTNVYANPAAYYGRPVLPEESQTVEKK